jgi:hypothetical protein
MSLIQLHNSISVAALGTDVWSSAIPPAGKKITLLKFGGYDQLPTGLLPGAIALQWGSAGAGWTTVVAGGGGFFESSRMVEFTGDGDKGFRVIRQNPTAALSRSMAAWLDAMLED